MFSEYWSKVDRGRIVIPSGCRRHFRQGLELTLDREKRFIAAMPCLKSKLKLDARDRLSIPKTLRDEANIGDVAVVVGRNDDYIEIWNSKSWEEEMAKAQAEAASLR